MVKDTLNSVLDNFKERTTNPFLGTLIVVWTLKNWKLIYSLFYFDNSLKLDDRLGKITAYFEEQSFLLNMGSAILMTLGVLILTYILISVSRLITEAYERIVVPVISKWTDKGSVVLKADFIALKEVVKQLEVRLEEERLAKVAAQNERDQADERILKLTTVNKDEKEILNPPSYRPEITDAEEDEHSFFIRVADQLKELGVSESMDILRKVKNGNAINLHDKVVDILVLEDLISLNTSSGDNGFYHFSDQGTRFLKFWNRFKKDWSDHP